VGLVTNASFIKKPVILKKNHHNCYKLFVTLDDDLTRKSIDGMGSPTLRGGLSKLCYSVITNAVVKFSLIHSNILALR